MQKRAAIGKRSAARAKRKTHNVLDPPIDKRSAGRGAVRHMQKRVAIGKRSAVRAKRLLRNVLDPPIDKRKRRQRRGETYAKSAQRLGSAARPEQSDYCVMFSTRRLARVAQTEARSNRAMSLNKRIKDS